MNKPIYDITDLYEAVKINDELSKENHNLYKEIDRYKNIINELEKWLKEQTEELHNITGIWTTVGQEVYEDVLKKLLDLK